MKPPDKGLLLSSRVDFTIPSPFAREHLYYLIQYRRYQRVPGYEVKRDFLHVRVQHPEDRVISSAVDGKMDTSAWRFQPEKVGSLLCANDLGTHAEQMVTQFTGRHVKRVPAMMDTCPRDLPLDTNVNVLMDFGGRRNRCAPGIPDCDWTRVRQRHLCHRHRRLARMDRDRLRPPDLYAAQPAESAAVRRCRLSARCQHAAFTCCGRPQRRLYRGVLEYLPFVL